MTTVIIATDAEYLPYVPCNLAQLARFGRRAAGVTLVVPPTVASETLATVTAAASSLNLELEIVTTAELDSFHSRGMIGDSRHVSYFTYIKLLFAEVLRHLDEILYLDVDTLIRAPIDDLLSWDLRHPLGAVPELGDTGIALFGTPRQPYFNAGVLRMSLRRLRQERCWDQAVAILAEQPVLPFQDQDVLNLLFRDRFDSLPVTFNVFDTDRPHTPELAVLRDPTIVHFTGPRKPWGSGCQSQFAREWRLQNRDVADFSGPVIEMPGGPSRHVVPTPQRSRLYAAAKRVLPAGVRQTAKRAALDILDCAIDRLDRTKSSLRPPRRDSPPTLSWPQITDDSLLPQARSDSGLDLLVSIARSGTNALGNVVQRSRPEVNYLAEVFMGFTTGLREGEMSSHFPWFAAGHPDLRKDMPWPQRTETERAFAAKMSDNIVEFTDALLAGRQGRTLIKIFPDHIHPAAFVELLRVFRPRLLFLRRDMVFTYISELRAAKARSWWGDDLTTVAYEVNDREALWYARKCDNWINLAALMANRLDLEHHWLTYGGLFTNGSDVSVLESFYPGLRLVVDSVTGALKSERTIQDRRSDEAVLGMIEAVSRLSVVVQAQLLRLPGNSVPA